MTERYTIIEGRDSYAVIDVGITGEFHWPIASYADPAAAEDVARVLSNYADEEI